MICKDAKNIEDYDFSGYVSDEELIEMFRKGSDKGPIVRSDSSLCMKLFRRLVESSPEIKRSSWCFDTKRGLYIEKQKGEWVDLGINPTTGKQNMS